MINHATRIGALLVVGGLSLSGCGGGDSEFPRVDPAPPPPAQPAPPAEPAQVGFTDFVRDQFAMTEADASEPVAVDELDFEFDDQDDPDAFSDLLGES